MDYTPDKMHEIFIDFVNSRSQHGTEVATVQDVAEQCDISEDEADYVIDAGRKIHKAYSAALLRISFLHGMPEQPSKID